MTNDEEEGGDGDIRRGGEERVEDKRDNPPEAQPRAHWAHKLVHKLKLLPRLVSRCKGDHNKAHLVSCTENRAGGRLETVCAWLADKLLSSLRGV